LTFWKAIGLPSKRYVAGETAGQAIEAARKVNAQGLGAILDYLGENVAGAEEARRAAAEYGRLLGLIHENKVKASVSLKASQLGLLISLEECLQNVRQVAREADRLGLFLWLDMERSGLARKTIELFETVRQNFSNVGLCLQACLVRTGGDLDKLMRTPGRPGAPLHVRLCKGAYKEPSAIAYAVKSAVDGNYRMLVQKVFDQGARQVIPAFATHDRELIDFILASAAERKVGTDGVEFQMLYGIQNQFLAGLARRGFQTGVYIPYGTQWRPYLFRRLRERKENIYFRMRNVFRA
jgi:proline dehydrogenase